MIRALFQEGSTSITTTGTANDVANGDAGVLRLNNATDLTITGFVAGVDGQRLTVYSVGAGNVFLSHQTGSSAANQLLNNVTSGPTPLAAGKGSATYQYDATTQRWRLLAHNQGAWLSVAYASGNFTSTGGGTWTVGSGDQIQYAYVIDGKSMDLAIVLNTTSISGTVSIVNMAFPSSYTNVAPFTFPGLLYDNSSSVASPAIVFQSLAAQTTVRVSLASAANLAAATDNTYIRLVVKFEVT